MSLRANLDIRGAPPTDWTAVTQQLLFMGIYIILVEVYKKGSEKESWERKISHEACGASPKCKLLLFPMARAGWKLWEEPTRFTPSYFHSSVFPGVGRVRELGENPAPRHLRISAIKDWRQGRKAKLSNSKVFLKFDRVAAVEVVRRVRAERNFPRWPAG